MNNVPTSNVWHKIILKKSSWKKRLKIYIFDEIFDNCLLSQPLLAYGHKYTTEGIFCILIHQIVEYWENWTWNCWTSFLKINPYSTKRWP